MKTVSIIVPLYNSEKYAPKLIESILNQTHKNIELILVDDGSPDNSGIIAQNFAQKDKRINVYHKTNGGCCDARNYGLSKASGDYIMFADGDDWLEKDCVEYLVKLAEENNCEMAMSDSIFTTSDRHQNNKDCIRIWTPEQATCGILYVETPVGPWNKLYSTKVIRENKIDFSVPWFGEGLYFSVTNAQYSNAIAVGHRKIYNYRLNNIQSGTTERKVSNAINSLWNIRNIKDKLHIRTQTTINAAEWHIHRNCFNLLWYIIESKDKANYKDLYKATYIELLKSTPRVFLKSKIGIGKRGLVLLMALMPHIMAKLATIRRQRKTAVSME